MFITEGGIDARRLAPEFARLLGDGGGLVAEASATNCEQIEPSHFLAYLARTAGTVVRVDLLEFRQVDPEQFCASLYEVALAEDRAPGIPFGLAPETLSAASLDTLDAFERAIAERGLERGTEVLFLLVLFAHLPGAVQDLLVAITGSEEAFERFCRGLNRRVGELPSLAIFEKESGRIVESAFDRSGRRVLDRLREETAALGYRKAAALHLLYALVGLEGGVMARAIQSQTVDPIREVHGYLSRELARPGTKRVADFELSRATLHDSVVRVLEQEAGAQARRENVPIDELHIARALVAAKSGTVADFLASRKVNLDLLRDYLARAENEAEEAGENRRVPISQIEGELKGRVLGQDHAVRQLLPWIKRLRFGFPPERGPAAVLLFLGPSGTGKTQLAKELARIVYGSEDALVMLEMGQFNSKESINIFIGSPPGYVGYGEGKLTNGLRDKPQSVVLFDEIEKAHEDVWVALLRFLDEGLISDPAGPTRDGRRCIVVLTSNLGADKLAERLPPDSDDAPPMDPEMERAIRDVVLPYLKRPEIYNRVGQKIVFRPFSPDTYKRLVQRQVEAETRKFLDGWGIRVEVMSDVVAWLASRAVESSLEGARCVPRLVTVFVVSPVIDLLTEQEERTIRHVVVSLSGSGTGTVAEEA